MDTILNNITDENIQFYLGGYGMFDRLCRAVCFELKTKIPNSKMIFITPYSSDLFLKNRNAKEEYDEIISPELNCRVKYAIIKRNEWMVEKADLIITYINYPFGGAYKSYCYAIKKNKKIINLGYLKK